MMDFLAVVNMKELNKSLINIKMKKVMFSIVVATAIVITSCGGETKVEEPNHSETASTKYACPMKCEGELTYDEKGECPKCHMDLEEVK